MQAIVTYGLGTTCIMMLSRNQKRQTKLISPGIHLPVTILVSRRLEYCQTPEGKEPHYTN
jgi:hypothetical protein